MLRLLVARAILTARQYGNACGTVYLESADVSRGTDLYIDTPNTAEQQTAFPMADDGCDYKRTYVNLNVIIGKSGRVKVLKHPVTDEAVTVRIRSLTLTSASSYLDLDGNTLKIRDPENRRMNDWNATAQGNVTLGGTALKPGALIWETPKLMFIVR